jgi:MED6 mediator sub complex component
MENIRNTCFRDPAWLQQFPLTKDSVLQYFALSQFYSRNSNNEVLKMQTLHNEIGDQEELFRKMTGIQYSLHHHEEPHLFIIKESMRTSPSKTSVLRFYYIMHGAVYQAPTERELVSARLTNILFAMRKALRSMRERRGEGEKRETPEQNEDGTVSFARMVGLITSYYSDYENIPDSSSPRLTL